MKKILFLILGLLFIQIASADTVNIDWSVDGQTYTQTSCTVGGDIILPTAPTKRGHTFLGWVAYTPIEYIEFTGTQYIDLGSLTTGYGFSVQFGINLTQVSRENVFVFGKDNNAIALFIVDSKFAFWQSGTGLQSSVTIVQGTKYDAEYIVRPTSVTMNINGIVTNINQTVILSANNDVKIAKSSSPMRAKIYYARIYDVNENLVRDFIPVLDKNGTPCMYDRVTDTCFYNSGTGDFIAGPVITE